MRFVVSILFTFWTTKVILGATCVADNAYGDFCVRQYSKIYWSQAGCVCSSRKLAVVTGANKGIGLAIVRGLCKLFDGDVLLTARSSGNGMAAVSQLKMEGLEPIFHQLDITNPDNIEQLKSFLGSTYEGIDVLVNNAGVDLRSATFEVRAEVNMAINFWGTLNVSNALFPLLKPHARVINLSSTSAKDTAKMCSESLRQRFRDQNLDMDKVKQLMNEFLQSVRDGTFREKGWPKSAYGVSKIGVLLMSVVQQRALLEDPRNDIVVNACCPGDVATAMSGFQGDKTTDEGADTPLYLALLPPNCTSPKGEFVVDRKIQKFP